ncbi:MAG: sulfotransferase, partial [Pseudomonadota bacterium]
LPFSQGLTFVAADFLCPGSKFILTLRDPDKWVESYIKYYRKDLGIEDDFTNEETFRDKLLYLEKGYMHRVMRQMLVEDVGGRPQVRWDLAFDRDFLKAAFQRHNLTVRRHFAQRPRDLLEIDVAAEPDTGRLLRFLGREDHLAQPFPHANKRT